MEKPSFYFFETAPYFPFDLLQQLQYINGFRLEVEARENGLTGPKERTGAAETTVPRAVPPVVPPLPRSFQSEPSH